jgi:hypothetical protein
MRTKEEAAKMREELQITDEIITARKKACEASGEYYCDMCGGWACSFGNEKPDVAYIEFSKNEEACTEDSESILKNLKKGTGTDETDFDDSCYSPIPLTEEELQRDEEEFLKYLLGVKK